MARNFVRLYLFLLIGVICGLGGILGAAGYDVWDIVPLTLLTLGVTLLVAVLAYLLHRFRNWQRGEQSLDARETLADYQLATKDPWGQPLMSIVGISATVAWLAATVLVVERALHFGVNGWLAFGLWILVSLIGVAVWGLSVGWTSTRRETRETMAARVAEEQEYQLHREERRRLAAGSGLAYEESSAELARRLGRFEQVIPDDFVAAETRHMSMRETMQIAQGLPAPEQLRVLLTRAANLEATSVVRDQVLGFPVAVFDLELVDLDTLANPEYLGQLDLAERVDLTTRRLTCWQATLPYPLPFVSSLFAFELANGDRWQSHLRVGPAAVPTAKGPPSEGDFPELPDGSGNGESGYDAERRRLQVDLTTEHEEYARVLMSAPAVLEAALSPHRPPFFVDGDLLVAMHHWQDARAADLSQGMAWLANLAQAFPWPELDRYRAAAAAVDRSPEHRGFYLTYRTVGYHVDSLLHADHWTLDRALERWQLGATRSGPALFQRSGLLTCWNGREAGSEPERTPVSFA